MHTHRHMHTSPPPHHTETHGEDKKRKYIGYIRSSTTTKKLPMTKKLEISNESINVF